MIVCYDVFYSERGATAAAVGFETWTSSVSAFEQVFHLPVSEVGEYVAGEFYRRELKPLLRVIETIDQKIDVHVIDAYCHLDAERAPGLGVYFRDALKDGALVIGVAKNRFRSTTHAEEVFRGGVVGLCL